MTNDELLVLEAVTKLAQSWLEQSPWITAAGDKSIVQDAVNLLAKYRVGQ